MTTTKKLIAEAEQVIARLAGPKSSEEDNAEALKQIEVDVKAAMLLHDLSPKEVLDHLQAVLGRDVGPDSPELSPGDRALLEQHGIDDEVFRTLNAGDGDRSYRELMARRAKSKGGAAA